MSVTTTMEPRRVPLVAHVIDRLDTGGMENGLANLIAGMPPERYRHAVVCLKDATSFRRRLDPAVPVVALGKREGKDLRVHGRLYRAFRALGPDIVHTRNLAALEAVLPAAAAGVRRRVHGEHGRDVFDPDGTSRKYRWLRRGLAPLVDRFVPLSVELERYLRDVVGVGAKKIRRITNGVDLVRFRPRPNGRPDVLPPGFASPGALVVGWVGRMEAVKAPCDLVQAFAELVGRGGADRRHRLRLLLVGDGRLRGEVERLVDALGLAPLVWLAGRRDDVPELLAAMDVFAMPSRVEGISNTILEAMATGLPVVATRVGGNAELVRDGETGRLVDRDDPSGLAAALEGYATDPDLRRRHGLAGRARAERCFGLDGMIARYLELYDELVGGGRG